MSASTPASTSAMRFMDTRPSIPRPLWMLYVTIRIRKILPRRGDHSLPCGEPALQKAVNHCRLGLGTQAAHIPVVEVDGMYVPIGLIILILLIFMLIYR